MIAFLGLSHLGLVTGVSWASKFGETWGVDTSKKIILYPEPGLAELSKKYSKNYHRTTDFSLIRKSKIIFITLDTPLASNSTKKLDSLIDKAIPNFGNNIVICIMSQVSVGYTRNLSLRITQKRPDVKFKLYYWLNTIIVGSAVERFLNPERIIIGKEKQETPIAPNLLHYLKKFRCPILEMNYESAELTKSAINLYLASSIITTNTIADYCEVVGADIKDITKAMKLDARIGAKAYLTPTLRISGGHLEREFIKLKKLAKAKKIKSGIVDALTRLNERRFLWAVERINKLVSNKSIITIWGLAYKKNSDSTYNAPSIKLITALNKNYSLQTYDPIAKVPGHIKEYSRIDDKYEALRNTSCLLILTEWDEFKDFDLKKAKRIMKNKVIIDCVGILYDRKEELNNFTYICMGLG